MLQLLDTLLPHWYIIRAYPWDPWHSRWMPHDDSPTNSEKLVPWPKSISPYIEASSTSSQCYEVRTKNHFLTYPKSFKTLNIWLNNIPNCNKIMFLISFWTTHRLAKRMTMGRRRYSQWLLRELNQTWCWKFRWSWGSRWSSNPRSRCWWQPNKGFLLNSRLWDAFTRIRNKCANYNLH